MRCVTYEQLISYSSVFSNLVYTGKKKNQATDVELVDIV